jgi:regulator of protease activity HflC (stomatin/prohibitin superfamily)
VSYNLIVLFIIGVLVFASIAAFLAAFFTVEHGTDAVIERFGELTRTAEPVNGGHVAVR